MNLRRKSPRSQGPQGLRENRGVSDYDSEEDEDEEDNLSSASSLGVKKEDTSILKLSSNLPKTSTSNQSNDPYPSEEMNCAIDKVKNAIEPILGFRFIKEAPIKKLLIKN
mmetsp:Transcript_1288/g.1172  ORF Transcript_1288/g.1172 Transcript_1288/m.1172 type:complete len:110 (+) Transcript_1288:1008-1337(+)|eukprot:CAMPEP_0114585392 /NCGR_PEP_ID=MMETSP0125-20121206/8958_1 /TAXON_ID=485358 ORGANISM="Aristerostoma sp., Strain ATCC 50986" /NCGR_SAMPLE_ID=MMETSP0125 /ASSEMBLY_ACC=CAM_ASM_000245 /LENGTH=109 /DNA_ID=CAMNT_0001780469 /DNA_START=1002 /DNA_END=1331 /DNA_ORIENTATION=+